MKWFKILFNKAFSATINVNSVYLVITGRGQYERLKRVSSSFLEATAYLKSLGIEKQVVWRIEEWYLDSIKLGRLWHSFDRYEKIGFSKCISVKDQIFK